MKRMGLSLGIMLCSGGIALAGASSNAVPAGARDILAATSPWSWHLTLRPPMVSAAALKAAGKAADKPALLPCPEANIETPPPPAAWNTVDFDAGSWVRSPAPLFGTRGEGSTAHALLAVRSMFVATAPAEVKKLYLTMNYRGGAVIYLNGKEVARTDMPEGEIKPETDARAYPDEAWVDAAGVALPPPVDQKAEHKERVAKRERSCGPIEIPVSALRQGINVLAVELHRSEFHPSAMTWWSFGQQHLYGRYRGWDPVGLNDLRLAAVGGGIEPNVARPDGVQVWNLDIHDRLEEINYGAPQAGLRPIRIVGARNGSYSGSVVLSSKQAIQSPTATITDLVQQDGSGKIPAAQVQVWYVENGFVASFQAAHPRLAFETLDPKAPAEVAVEKNGAATLPVRITVQIPKAAAAGHYKATLTLAAGGTRPTEIPVLLDVANWVVPDPRNYRTFVGMYESPNTLADYYNVPEWSEKHWALVDRSFSLLESMGSRVVNIPVVDRTQFGNDEGMVYWVKKSDGTYDYDFTVFDRFLKLVKKHLGVPTFVALHIWHVGGWEMRGAAQENTVTVIDAQSKARSHVQVPVFGTEASKAFWKPVVEGLREHLAKEGLEKSMCFGILSDGTAPVEVFKMFSELAPGVGWTRGCHTATTETRPSYAIGGGASVVYQEFCYGRDIVDPAKKIPRFWDMAGPGTSYLREDFDDNAPYMVRLTAERSLYGGTRGFGRCILDGWGYPATNGTKHLIYEYNRWLRSSCAQREPTTVGLAQPGPDGAMNSVRLDVMREGIQEAEAAIVIGEAMEKHADKLGAELAGRCRQLVADRITICRSIWSQRSLAGTQNGNAHVGAEGDWQERSAKLYALAAEVTAKLEPKP